MVIVVIGDYESPKYQELLQLVKIYKPEEEVIDLSRHQNLNPSIMRVSRFADIETAHQVVISNDWDNNIDTKRDITQAQFLHKETFIYRDGQFLPFPEFAHKL